MLDAGMRKFKWQNPKLNSQIRAYRGLNRAYIRHIQAYLGHTQALQGLYRAYIGYIHVDIGHTLGV
jgi:hypothetical protein